MAWQKWADHTWQLLSQSPCMYINNISKAPKHERKLEVMFLSMRRVKIWSVLSFTVSLSPYKSKFSCLRLVLSCKPLYPRPVWHNILRPNTSATPMRCRSDSKKSLSEVTLSRALLTIFPNFSHDTTHKSIRQNLRTRMLWKYNIPVKHLSNNSLWGRKQHVLHSRIPPLKIPRKLQHDTSNNILY